MRNLKKILALVLALVMSMSLMAGASFKDSKDIDGKYNEAVEVLNALKVFQGRPDGNFDAKAPITRAEVAAILYRILSRDVNNNQVSMHTGLNKFSDVKSTSWYAGYVNYCANGEYVKGRNDGKYYPNDNVTGYEALAMILRAIGYDKNHEFSGPKWQTHVATTAQQRGLLKNLSDVVLSQPASREVVAEILFQTILVPQVQYTPALGYNHIAINGTVLPSLGYQNFGLLEKPAVKDDKWGRPSNVWQLDIDRDLARTADKDLVAIPFTPVAQYTTAVTECQVAQDAKFNGSKSYDVYTNGAVNKTSRTLYANNYVNTVGGTGRATFVYNDRIVFIDTLLAKVDKVSAIRKDLAGHTITPAKLTLKVYTSKDSDGQIVEITNNVDNFPYVADEMLLVSAQQRVDGSIDFTKDKTNRDTKTAVNLVIQGKAESFVGAQSTFYVAGNKHTIDKVDYNDNIRFHKNDAQTSPNYFTWYKDQLGNLIGATTITSNNYAVLKAIRWAGSNGFENGYAEAQLIDMDGKEYTAIIDRMDGDHTGKFDWDANPDADNIKTDYLAAAKTGFDNQGNAWVSMEFSNNSDYSGYALYRVDKLLNGHVSLEGRINTKTGPVDIVKFVEDGVLNKDASVIAKGNDLNCYVNNTTKFLVKNGNDYTAVTGINNMVSYTKADMFYVDLNGDNIAEYVYVKGFTPDLGGNPVAFIMGDYNYQFDVDGRHYYVPAIINGEVKNVKIANSNEALAKKLGANHKKLFVLTLDNNGVATAAKMITADNDGTIDTTYGAATVSGGKAIYLGRGAYTTADGFTVIDGKNTTVTTDDVSYRVNNAKVFGDVSSVSDIDWDHDGVWAVFTDKQVASYDWHEVSTLYVARNQKLGTTPYFYLQVLDSTSKKPLWQGKVAGAQDITVPTGTAAVDLKWIKADGTIDTTTKKGLAVGTPYTVPATEVFSEDHLTKHATGFNVTVKAAVAPVTKYELTQFMGVMPQDATGLPNADTATNPMYVRLTIDTLRKADLAAIVTNAHDIKFQIRTGANTWAEITGDVVLTRFTDATQGGAELSSQVWIRVNYKQDITDIPGTIDVLVTKN